MESASAHGRSVSLAVRRSGAREGSSRVTKADGSARANADLHREGNGREVVPRDITERRSVQRPDDMGRGCELVRSSYLVDPASSDMLVSKIKPCRCKYEPP